MEEIEMLSNALLHIFKREFKSYFVSPIAYIVIAIFLVVSGWFFFSPFFLADRADLRNFFSLLPMILAFTTPAVTMRLFSEEFKTGSYEATFTLPVRTLDILAAKFLASVAFIALMVLPTLSYPIFITFIGDLDWGPVLGGYIGTILLSATYCAIGLFASTLTKNQIIAFILGLIFCFFLTMIDKMLFFLPTNSVGFFQFLGSDFHFRNISKGIIDSRDLIYFLSIGVIALLGAFMVISKKK